MYKYVFDVSVHTNCYSQNFTVVAKNDVDARNQALKLDKMLNGLDYKEASLRLLYCEISMVRKLDP